MFIKNKFQTEEDREDIACYLERKDEPEITLDELKMKLKHGENIEYCEDRRNIMPYSKIVAQTNENTVITEYTPQKQRSGVYQSEAELDPSAATVSLAICTRLS